jgi:hypothetical protein
MQLTPSEADNRSARQEISSILPNPEVHYRVYTGLSLVHTLSRTNLV